MFKRIFLFLLTNVLVLFVIGISTAIISKILGINIGGYFDGNNYLSLFIYALIVGFSGSFISLFLSKFMAKKAYGIEIVDENIINNLGDKEKFVYEKVLDLSQILKISMPEVGFYNSDEPNAFATGATKNSSLVAVSSGLLDTMSKDEIEGVLAHEMAHIENGDMVTMTLLQGILNTFVIFLSRILSSIIDNILSSKSDENESSNNSPSWVYFIVSGILEILFSVLASLVVMKFSRYREFRADEGSSKLVGKEKMILALQKLKGLQDRVFDDNSNFSSMKISGIKKDGFMSLFASHPSLDDRIENLQNKF